MRWIAWLGLALAVTAQAQVPADPFIDCTANPTYQQFDFWLGEWRVHDAKGNYQGSNTVESVQRGCLVTENWRSATGGGGQSLNYFDPRDNTWHQLWIDSGASIIDIRGGIEDGSMVLVGSIFYLKPGTKHAFRGTWTLLEDGRVRQFFEQQTAEGEWFTWFEGFYSRAGDEETGSSS